MLFYLYLPLCRGGGVCQPYIGTRTNRASICDDYFTIGVTHVYIPYSRLNGNQDLLRILMQKTLLLQQASFQRLVEMFP